MDDDVRNLLDVWGLSQYTDIFEANKINIKSLGLLDSTLARELIIPVGDRAIFLKNLEHWKTITENSEFQDNSLMIEDLPVEFVDVLNEKHKRLALENITNINTVDNVTSSSVLSVTPASPVPSCSNSEATNPFTDLCLEELLNSTAEGKAIINLHLDGLLSNNSRRKLCNIIIKSILNDDPEKRVSSTDLIHYAQQIKLMFPKENISTYFIPYVNNSKLKIKRCAKGKLYDCLQNRRREFREAKLIKKKQSNTATPTPVPSSDTDDENEDVHWLNTFCEPWSVVEAKWNKTIKYRLRQLNENQMSIAEYMNLYPALKKSTGYHLLKEDFKQIYPACQDNLVENFHSTKEKLLEYLLKKNNRNSDPLTQGILQNCQENLDKTEDVKFQETINLLTFILLALTLVQPQSKTKKCSWRPTKFESKDGFITHITRSMDLQDTIERRRDRFATLGVTVQPFIVVVGQTLSDIQTYFVVVNNTFYVVNSILDAVDACFKIFFSLHCNYPQECVAVWTFIQKAFYKFKTPWDKEFVSVNTLLSDLNILT